MMTCPIPDMTWDHQQAWPQPNPHLFDWITVPNHVIVSKISFHILKQYDTTFPSGVYEGKMWRRRENKVDYLVWYGESPEPNQCSIHYIPILLKETIDLLTSTQTSP